MIDVEDVKLEIGRRVNCAFNKGREEGISSIDALRSGIEAGILSLLLEWIEQKERCRL